MTESHRPRASLLPRGVHPLDILSKAGNPVLMSVDREGRFAGWSEVLPGTSYAATERQLAADLDAYDPPVIPLHTRPMRLMRRPPPMSPALQLGLARLALKRGQSA